MDKLLVEFGGKVSKMRRKKKMTQEGLAEEADLHRTYIGQVEAGKRNIALKNIKKIADALCCRVKDLL